METIFLTLPRTFKDTDNTDFEIIGLSAKVAQTTEVFIGNTLPIKFELKFWRKENDVYLVDDIKLGVLEKDYTLPGLGKVEIMSGLFSSNKQTVYDAANLVCTYYGYTLLPLTDQTFLNLNM